MLVTYAGALNTDEVIARLGEHLEFVALGAIQLPGPHARIYRSALHLDCKPLLFFAAGRHEARRYVSNFYRHAPAGKKMHPWEQDLGCASYYISRLTDPGDHIVDPFLSALERPASAAVEAGRRFVGCDIDAASIATATERITAALTATAPAR